MFEVLWKGVKGFLGIVGVFFSFVQGGFELTNGKEENEVAE